MRVVFRVDASIKMGIGHIMRCITLADELKKQNHEIIFICRELIENLILLIKYPILVLPKDDSFHSDDLYSNWLGTTQEKDSEETIQVIPKNTDLLVVDSYALDRRWHEKLRPYSKKIMVIDDLADRQFDCDMMLNQNLGTQIKDYKDKVPRGCKLLLGCNYALLRPEFPGLRGRALKKRKKTKEIKNILISIGGIDINNLTYDILQEIKDNFNVTVVLGESSPHNKVIQKYAKGKNIKVIINANNMAELMLETDLSIGAGGSTSWERCCLGLPTLLFITEDNQRKIAANLEQLGAVKVVDNFKENLYNVLNNFSCWQVMSQRAQIVCDGAGVKRVEI